LDGAIGGGKRFQVYFCYQLASRTRGAVPAKSPTGGLRNASGYNDGAIAISIEFFHNDRYGHIDLEAAMITEVSAVNFRQNLGEMLNQVQYRNDSIVINKDGKPVAALVDADLFARIRRLRDRFDALSARVAGAYTDVPVEQGLSEIDAVVAAGRKRK
jgi:prevent-host-death family protein